ncbi:MAG: hypothetical protein C5B50_09655 [Verrucomicrobia bacterium]|nr:MAG: hypothetical protein C5B50_09655 [Verrucomicrobiota bacterium]
MKENSSVLPPGRVLRRLFLTLFLRGRSSRGLQKSGAPKTVGSKLALTLLFYSLFGLMATMFIGQPLFVLTVYLHSMTLAFLGMFIASSAGEVLFNKEEADILMHRPIDARSLLWSKIGVMVQVSLWVAAAFNLVGLVVGAASPDGGWLFPLAHILSTATEALFCTSCIVLTYQLCLRWFGRERLDALMTTAQVIVAVVVVMGGQLAPQLFRFRGRIGVPAHSWWMAFIPPVWFAGFDEALTGHGGPMSWILASVGVGITAGLLLLAFGKLARDYERGLQTLQEAAPARPQRSRRRWAEKLANVQPLRWWLRDPVSRASFLLMTAYLTRDRDVKLRVYPGLAPFLVMPVVFLVGMRSGVTIDFGVAFSSAYLAAMPVLALNLLQYSQQWQAADVFRSAPLIGPARLCHGARRAVLCFLIFPALLVVSLLVWFGSGGGQFLAMLLPGIIALPIYSLLPVVRGRWAPLSQPTEEARSAGRAVSMMGVMLSSMALAGVAVAARTLGILPWFLLVEAILSIALYVILRSSMNAARWQPLE